jgi:hypothetical protein
VVVHLDDPKQVKVAVEAELPDIPALSHAKQLPSLMETAANSTVKSLTVATTSKLTPSCTLANAYPNMSELSTSTAGTLVPPSKMK